VLLPTTFGEAFLCFRCCFGMLVQVLAFPSNDFNQEPNSNQEIHRIMDQEYDVSANFIQHQIMNEPFRAPLMANP